MKTARGFTCACERIVRKIKHCRYTGTRWFYRTTIPAVGQRLCQGIQIHFSSGWYETQKKWVQSFQVVEKFCSCHNALQGSLTTRPFFLPLIISFCFSTYYLSGVHQSQDRRILLQSVQQRKSSTVQLTESLSATEKSLLHNEPIRKCWAWKLDSWCEFTERWMIVISGVCSGNRPIKHFQGIRSLSTASLTSRPHLLFMSHLCSIKQVVHPIFIANWRSMSVYICAQVSYFVRCIPVFLCTHCMCMYVC